MSLFSIFEPANMPDPVCLRVWSPLPVKEGLSIVFGHVAEAVEENQQVLEKFSWCSVDYHLRQNIWVTEVNVLTCLRSRPLHQDPIAVDDEFTKGWVKCWAVAKRVQPVHKVSIPLREVKAIPVIHPPCQGLCADLYERKTKDNLSFPTQSVRRNNMELSLFNLQVKECVFPDLSHKQASPLVVMPLKYYSILHSNSQESESGVFLNLS